MYRIVANCAATTLGKRNRHGQELPDDGQVSDDRPDAYPALLAEAGAMRDRVDTRSSVCRDGSGGRRAA